ncbi:MAG: FxsA family protein [Gammaproteobacteria bacterium]|jgi:UPF0716 protein FxsA
MFKFLFLSFLLVPLAELYVLIQVGSVFGALTTIGLCLFTAALGAVLLRLQGIETLKRVQSRISQGQMPATDLIEGFILLVSGLLLLTPGLLTDLAGFLCLVPGLRTAIAIFFLGQVVLKYKPGSDQQTVIVEGEFWDEEKKQLNITPDNQNKDL